MTIGLRSLIQRYASRLRFPLLALLAGLLFVVDLFVPDVIPVADELLLGLLTALLASWRTRRQGPPQQPPEQAAVRPEDNP